MSQTRGDRLVTIKYTKRPHKYHLPPRDDKVVLVFVFKVRGRGIEYSSLRDKGDEGGRHPQGHSEGEVG